MFLYSLSRDFGEKFPIFLALCNNQINLKNKEEITLKNYQKINVLCFGGGTGMPSLLSGLKPNPWLNITAVVNMFDTGGSSGELKDQFGILPIGDVLKCILALAKDESHARKILLQRIQNKKSSIHTAGNVLLMGFEKVYEDFLLSIDALGQILETTGEVLPVTMEHSTLTANCTNGTKLSGETSVDLGIYEGMTIDSLILEPSVNTHSRVIEAISEADVICIGPGSFYTSILPNFLPTGIKESITESKAKIIFISNLLTEGWGMKNFDLRTIVSTLESYIGRQVDVIVANNQLPSQKVLSDYLNERKCPVRTNEQEGISEKLILAPLWQDPNIARHDKNMLGYLVSNTISALVM